MVSGAWRSSTTARTAQCALMAGRQRRRLWLAAAWATPVRPCCSGLYDQMGTPSGKNRPDQADVCSAYEVLRSRWWGRAAATSAGVRCTAALISRQFVALAVEISRVYKGEWREKTRKRQAGEIRRAGRLRSLMFSFDFSITFHHVDI